MNLITKIQQVNRKLSSNTSGRFVCRLQLYASSNTLLESSELVCMLQTFSIKVCYPESSSFKSVFYMEFTYNCFSAVDSKVAMSIFNTINSLNSLAAVKFGYAA
jgi:hypothetical protein